MTIRTRIATTADCSTIAAVGESAFTDAFGPHNTEADLQAHITNTYTPPLIDQQMKSGATYLVAEYEGKVVGFGKLRPFQSTDQQSDAPTQIPASHPFEVHQLYVLSAFHRLGIGTKLMQDLSGLAESLGADGLVLGVWEKASWAIPFYRKWGMDQVGTLEFRVGQDVQSDFLMFKPLANQAAK